MTGATSRHEARATTPESSSSRRRPPVRRGPDHPAWKGEAATASAKRHRAQRGYRRLGRCARCRSAPAVDRHHRDNDPGNNTRDNVMFVCRACHIERTKARARAARQAA